MMILGKPWGVNENGVIYYQLVDVNISGDNWWKNIDVLERIFLYTENIWLAKRKIKLEYKGDFTAIVQEIYDNIACTVIDHNRSLIGHEIFGKQKDMEKILQNINLWILEIMSDKWNDRLKQLRGQA